jgi:hypothetical protein
VKGLYDTNVVAMTPEAGHDVLDRLALVSATIARLEPRLAEARRELHAVILEAHAQGVSVVVISRVSGLTRQRVHQIIQRGNAS